MYLAEGIILITGLHLQEDVKLTLYFYCRKVLRTGRWSPVRSLCVFSCIKHRQDVNKDKHKP